MQPESIDKPVNFNCRHCLDIGRIRYWLKGLGTQNRFCDCELGQKLKREFESVDPRPKRTYEIASDVRLYPLDTQRNILYRCRAELLRQAMDNLFVEEHDPKTKISVELEFSYYESHIFYDRVENYYPDKSDRDEEPLVKGKGYPSVNELALVKTHNRLIIELRYQVIKEVSK